MHRMLNHTEESTDSVIVKQIADFERIVPDFFQNEWHGRKWEYGWGVGTILSFLGKTQGKWLDIGTGTSRLPRYLSRIGFDVSVYEFDHPMFRNAHQGDNITFIPIPSISENSVLVDNQFHIDAPDESFDVITNISVIEHIPHAKEHLLIKEMARVAKPGAYIYITTDVNVNKDYRPELRAGNPKMPLHWHVYDNLDLKEKVLDPMIAHGLIPLGDMNFVAGKSENRLDHEVASRVCNIIGFFARKE